VLTGTGLISGNGLDGQTDSGGGVYVNGHAKFLMSGGEISGNTAKTRGGGVVTFSEFEMSGGLITRNTAPAAGGGGVFTSSYGGKVTTTGGDISGNYGGTDMTN
jgi:hypothetical protein